MKDNWIFYHINSNGEHVFEGLSITKAPERTKLWSQLKKSKHTNYGYVKSKEFKGFMLIESPL